LRGLGPLCHRANRELIRPVFFVCDPQSRCSQPDAPAAAVPIRFVQRYRKAHGLAPRPRATGTAIESQPYEEFESDVVTASCRKFACRPGAPSDSIASVVKRRRGRHFANDLIGTIPTITSLFRRREACPPTVVIQPSWHWRRIVKENGRDRALVTGGAGFIGSHLCRRLVRDGLDVICVDNFYTGTKRNILDLLDAPQFEVLRHDITFPLYVEVDQIFNLACPASPIHYQNDPVQTTKVNVHGAINMLGLAKRVKAKILQASTSEVYGDPAVHPQVESYWGNVNPIGPRACYDEGKRCAETLFFDYHRQHRLQIKVARIFNTYGPGMHPDDGRVVSNFIVQALRGDPITIYGDGSQTRSFCYVDDLVEALTRLMKTPDDVTGPMNLGNPVECTILDLAERIVRLTHAKSRIIMKELPTDDPRKRKPDISLAESRLGWRPSVTLDEGLPRTIDYFSRLLRG
jgi:UDP-glucuronate decarboxylase